MTTAMRTVLQEWECLVQGIDEGCVACHMIDLTDKSSPDEFAEIYIDEFKPSDRDRLIEGRVFYLVIGYEQDEFGTIRNFRELNLI